MPPQRVAWAASSCKLGCSSGAALGHFRAGAPPPPPHDPGPPPSRPGGAPPGPSSFRQTKGEGKGGGPQIISAGDTSRFRDKARPPQDYTTCETTDILLVLEAFLGQMLELLFVEQQAVLRPVPLL